MKMLFPGSFDPFTKGYESIANQALDLCDELIIGIAKNSDKKNPFCTDDTKATMIAHIFRNNPKVTIKVIDGLTSKYCAENDIKYIVRGVRSARDFETERGIAQLNEHISGIKTLLLFGDPSLVEISSTMVRELIKYGEDVSEYIPSDIGYNKEEKRWMLKNKAD